MLVLVAAAPAAAGWDTLPPGPLTVGPAADSGAWTGRELVVWAKSATGDEALGAALDAASGTWRLLPPLGAPGGHRAVWSGSVVVVWGGLGEGASAAYEPESHTWRPIAPAPIPRRVDHAMVWTGRRVLVWGGRSEAGNEPYADGASYDPQSDRWARLPAASIAARSSHTAVWTGKSVIVWGGIGGGRDGRPFYLADGAAYDPPGRRWQRLPPPPRSIAGRSDQVATWTGREMVVWGGWRETPSGSATYFSDGAAYDPARRRWRTIAASPLAPRASSTAVWTGGEILIWGGLGERAFGDGAAYRPLGDLWTMLPEVALAPRGHHVAVWTGRDMLVWGGTDFVRFFVDGAGFRPSPAPPSSASPTPAPARAQPVGQGGWWPAAGVAALAAAALLVVAARRARRARGSGGGG